MGTYDNGTYDQFDNPYKDEREDARSKLARLMAEREAKMQGYMSEQEKAGDLNYGDEITRGATLGSVVPGYGTAIGAGVGALAGGKKAYDVRRAEGQDSANALWGTIMDFPAQIGNMLESPSAAPLAAQMGGMYQQQQAQSRDPMNYSSQGVKPDAFGNEVEQFKFQDPDEEIE